MVRGKVLALGAGGVLPSRHIESFLRVFKQFTHHFVLDGISVRADLGGHLKYSQRWSGVRAGVLLGAQGAVRRGESRGGL